MATQLQDVINAARGRHAAFHPSRVPSKVVGDYLGDLQNEFIQKALQRDKQFLGQSANIMLALTTSMAGGAGTGVGMPGRETPGGGFSASPVPAGNVVDVDTDPADGATILLDETVVSSATGTTLRRTAAGWTVNIFANRLVEITQGTGAGQRREVLSNTSDTLTISTGSDRQQWATVPDATSLFHIVLPSYGTGEDFSVVAAVPPYQSQNGYLVKIDASGNPFIDLTAPLVAQVEVGVDLPPNQGILGGSVLYNDGDRDPLTFVTELARYNPARWPAVFTIGNQLFLCGYTGDWLDAVQLVIRYAPIAPPFVSLTDYFLLPDSARPALVAAAAAFMAMRVAGMPAVTIDAAPHMQRAATSEASWLSSLRLTRGTRRIRFIEGEL